MLVYLGIGSNLGNRRENIKEAVKQVILLNKTKVLKLSRLIQTHPVGGPEGQRIFLNAALKIETSLAPLTLLRKLKNIEKSLGRIKGVRNGPRPIDLDILLYSDLIIKNKILTVPHPKMFVRDFVVRPLAEIL
jgi:2-amino-4-hydroxy-6-hydroxymethyldihydropteridine diphosphokinase